MLGAWAVILVSCTAKQPDPAITFAEGTSTEISVSAAGAEPTVKFTSAIDWKAVSSDKSFITVEPESGVGGDCEIKITVGPYSDKTKDREGSVTISSGNVSKTLKVKQAAKGAIDIADKTYNVTHEGGEVKVEVGHNVDLNISISQKWTRLKEEAKSYVTEQICFTVDPSEIHEERTARITFKSKDGKTTQTVDIIQAAAPVTEITIKDLVAKAGDSASDFQYKFKDVVVSFNIGTYCYLEDASGAVLFKVSKANETFESLTAGKVINGEVSGSIKKEDGLARISTLDISKAVLSETKSIPCTKVELSDLVADYDNYLSRRIMLQGITIEKGTRSGVTADRTGTISKNEATAKIYAEYTASPAILDAGIKGDLIGFPSYSGTTKKIWVFRSEDFQEAAMPAEETAFTQTEEPGIYDISGSTPVSKYIFQESDQTCAMTYATSSTFAVSSFYGGYAVILNMGSQKITNGRIFNASLSKIGSAAAISSLQAGEFSAVVARRFGKKAWVRDSESKIGFIITVE